MTGRNVTSLFVYRVMEVSPVCPSSATVRKEVGSLEKFNTNINRIEELVKLDK